MNQANLERSIAINDKYEIVDTFLDKPEDSKIKRPANMHDGEVMYYYRPVRTVFRSRNYKLPDGREAYGTTLEERFPQGFHFLLKCLSESIHYQCIVESSKREHKLSYLMNPVQLNDIEALISDRFKRQLNKAVAFIRDDRINSKR